MNQYDLSNIPTCELVWELERREGVSTCVVDPYEDKTVSANGPAIILTIID